MSFWFYVLVFRIIREFESDGECVVCVVSLLEFVKVMRVLVGAVSCVVPVTGDRRCLTGCWLVNQLMNQPV